MPVLVIYIPISPRVDTRRQAAAEADGNRREYIRRAEAMQAEACADLDDALENGWKIIAQETVNDPMEQQIAFVLRKPCDPPPPLYPVVVE